MQLFTPVGEGRALALTTLRLFVEAIADDEVDLAEVDLAEAVLATAVPESPDNSQATVAGTTGVALDLLDQVLGAGRPDAPKGLAPRVRLPRVIGLADALLATSWTSPIVAGRSVRWMLSLPSREVRRCRLVALWR